MRELRMKLTCTFILSGDAEEAKRDLEEFVEQANQELLVKGAPARGRDEASKITSWELSGSTLRMTIESGPYVRAPAAILRIRKALVPILGKKFRIGIRDIKVGDFTVSWRAGAPIPASVVDELRKIPGVDDARVDGDRVTVALSSLTYQELKQAIPDRVVDLAQSTVERAVKPPPPPTKALPIVRVGKPKPVKFSRDPAEVAVELGWVKEFPGRGQWIYTTPYAKLFEAIKSVLLREVVHKLGFQPFLLPKLIPLEVMERMPGYLDDIPEGMYYVCPPPREPEAFDEFKKLFKVRRKAPREVLKGIIKDPAYVLAPAQCEPFWYFYGGETFRVEDMPFKYYDCSGWTYRWEGGGVEGLVRVQEFQRIELTYVGTPEQVVEIRDSIVDRCVEVADEILDLEWRVVAAIPFYMREGEIAVDVHDSWNVPAYDVEIYLPYRGPREEAEWLEVAGCFVHKRKFVDAFKIREVKNREIWTGCTGLGLSRWVAAFLAEHGFNPDDWPSEIREAFGEYSIPRGLSWPRGEGA